jgi:adenylylsulfate kinase-like enzyme
MSLRWVAGKEESEKRVAAVQALRPGSVVHLAGICGTGMSAVASLLKQLGFQIQGSRTSW